MPIFSALVLFGLPILNPIPVPYHGSYCPSILILFVSVIGGALQKQVHFLYACTHARMHACTHVFFFVLQVAIYCGHYPSSFILMQHVSCFPVSPSPLEGQGLGQERMVESMRDPQPLFVLIFCLPLLDSNLLLLNGVVV